MAISFIVAAALLAIVPAASVPVDTASGAEGECAAPGECAGGNALADAGSASLQAIIDRAVEAEAEGRSAMHDFDADASRRLFEEAIGLAARGGLEASAVLKDVFSSAHLLLGTMCGHQNLFDECSAHHQVAHRDPRVRSGALLLERPHIFREDKSYEIRMHVEKYMKCLYATHRDDEAREVFKDALAHKHWRHDWQCTLPLSPATWNLRAQAWWELPEAANGAEDFTKALEKNQKQMRKETRKFFKHVEGTEGPQGVYLSEETDVNGTKPWLELHLLQYGQELEEECSVMPTLCKLLREFKSHFHPGGQVKLSMMRGGTTALPHCGPCDTKLRLHHAILLPEFRKAEISVGGVTKHWAEGRSLLFDDSFQHTVDFDADPGAKRVVLIADFVHPDVPKSEVPSLSCR